MNEQLSSAGFWNARYLAGDTGWDKGRVSPPIARMVDEGLVRPGRVVALGSGPGWEALHLARRGFEVTAVDFAPEACRRLSERAAKAGLTVRVLEADLFELAHAWSGAFELVLEHTCFCAIDPTRRGDYVRTVSSLLVPGGRLFGLFYAHGRDGGPPFTTSEAELREAFTPAFTFERLVRAPDSLPGRAGEELEAVLRREEA